MILNCSTFRLRPWQLSDKASLVENANNKKIWDNLRDFFPHPYTLADAEGWLQLQSEKPLLTSFAIEVEGKAVGGIGLVPGADVARISAEIGYWLGEPYWGRGIVSEAVKAIADYGFTQLDLVKIFACVFAKNPKSMRVLEKAGFEREAILKKAIIKNGIILDEHYYAIWKDTI